MAPREADTSFETPCGMAPIPPLPPIQDDYERSKEKALELLRTVLPESAWMEFTEKAIITLTGKRGHYTISPYSQTEVRNLKSGRCLAYTCMQLSIPAPTYDRMVAEYILIKNAEEVYWKTANIFSRSAVETATKIATLIFIAFDIALFTNLVIEFVTTP